MKVFLNDILKYFVIWVKCNKTLPADHRPPLRKNDIQLEEYQQEQGLDGNTCDNLSTEEFTSNLLL